jgi:hypothetical protein
MTISREEVIKKYKLLQELSSEAQNRIRKEHNVGKEVGFITRESIQIAKLVPLIWKYKITDEELGLPSLKEYLGFDPEE